MDIILGSTAFAASALSLAALAILHLIKPDIAPSWRMVSEYAIGEHGWVLTLCFTALAVGCLCLSLALFPHVTSLVGRIGLVLLVAAAVGLAIAAFNPTDPAGTAPDQMSRHGTLHGHGFMIGVPSLTLALLLIGHNLGDSRWDGTRMPLLIVAYLGWAAVALMGFCFAVLLPKAGGIMGPAVPVGWPNRLLMVAYAVWIMLAAWPLVAERTFAEGAP